MALRVLLSSFGAQWEDNRVLTHQMIKVLVRLLGNSIQVSQANEVTDMGHVSVILLNFKLLDN